MQTIVITVIIIFTKCYVLGAVFPPENKEITQIQEDKFLFPKASHFLENLKLQV